MEFDYYTHYGELLEEKVEEYIDNLIFEHETYGKIKHALELHKHRLDEDNNFLMQSYTLCFPQKVHIQELVVIDF